MAKEKTDKKNEFTKTKELSAEEVKGIMNTDYGPQLKLQDVKVNHHIIMKIIAPVEVDEYEHGGETKKSHKLWCTYKPKGCEGFDLKVQAGEGAVTRLQEKFPGDSYVGKYAFFSRTQFEGRYPQFINPLDKYTEHKDKDELFKKTADSSEQDSDNSTPSGTQDELNISKFDEFKTKYFETAKKEDLTPSAVHMLGCFLATYDKKRVVNLLAKCRGSVNKHNDEKVQV